MARTNTVKTWGHTNALVKQWVAFFRDSMVAAGWEQTAHPGQLDPATITIDSSPSQVNLGYINFVLDDSLKEVSPIALRAYFVWGNVGSTGNQPTLKGPQVYLNVGWGFDAAGQMEGESVSSGVCGPSGYELVYKPGLEIFAAGDGWATIFHGIGFSSGNQGYFYARQIGALAIERGRLEDGSLDPNCMYVTRPTPNRNNSTDPSNLSGMQYFQGSYPGGSNTYYVSLECLYLSKQGAAIGPWLGTKGPVGYAAISGSVEGQIQAQPLWKAYPRIEPLVSALVVPSDLMVPGQEFTASLDGINEYRYVALGAAAGWTGHGAMYAIDSWVGRTYCPAVRIG